jgi:hypothetical protein
MIEIRKKKAPTGASVPVEAPNCSAGFSRDLVKADFEEKGKYLVTEYWMHFGEDNTELRFPEKPPTLHVWCDGLTEFTATYSTESSEGFVPAVPYGRRWKRMKTPPPDFVKLRTERVSTVWKRRVQS